MTISKCLELTVFIFNNKYPSSDIVILYLWDIVILYLWNNYLGENEVFQTVFFSILINRNFYSYDKNYWFPLMELTIDGECKYIYIYGPNIL